LPVPNPVSRGVFNLLFGARRKALGTLPGPEPGLLGTAGDFMGAPPWEVCARYAREYGGVTLIWLVGTPGLVLNDPELIEQVLVSRAAEFEKGSLVEVLKPVVTTSVFITRRSEGWAEQRRADPFDQPWTEDWLAAQVGPMQAAIAAVIEPLIGGPSIDLVPVLRRLTFDAFAVAVVGETLPQSVFDDFILLATAADARVKAVRPLGLVGKPRGFAAAFERFYSHFIDRVAAGRAPNPAGVDLMSRTLREVPAIADRVLADILAHSFFGGLFSSSTTLAGALHQLHKEPAADERLADEAAALAPALAQTQAPAQAGGGLTLERLRGARWIEAVTYESLRILPAVRVFTRTPLAATQLAGITLPAGSTVMISNQHLHRDPAHWRDPDRFDPARWLDGGIDRDPLGSGHFFPFGRGPRACVAASFAMVFLQTALATIGARAKVVLDSAEPFEEDFFFGVILPKGLTGRFTSR
jgi:cytochrome P450